MKFSKGHKTDEIWSETDQCKQTPSSKSLDRAYLDTNITKKNVNYRIYSIT